MLYYTHLLLKSCTRSYSLALCPRHPRDAFEELDGPDAFQEALR
jgi:hypothetical protein